MDSRERDAISNLFQKLRDVERQAGPRDAEAERFISDEAQRLQGAPYYMAQTIVMQDMALNAKQQEVEDLRHRLEQAEAGRSQAGESGGFLSRMFGGGTASQAGAARPATPQGGPWGSSAPQAPQYAAPPSQYAPQAPQYAPQPGGFGRGMGGGGGGFLAGAAQTAMGVAGGVVLGNAIGGMLGGHGGLFGGAGEQVAEVQETTNNFFETPQDAAQDVADDPAVQDASYDDGGGWDDSEDI